MKSSGCGDSSRHEVQVRREGAVGCLLPACFTLSDCPLCRSAPRRAGPRDRHHHHGLRGHRHRPLQAYLRCRGRFFQDLQAARAVLVAQEVAAEQVWRRHGGQGGAGAQRSSPGRSSGGCGRWRQVAGDFLRRNAAVLQVSHRVRESQKVCMYWCCCTRVQCAHVVIRARLGRPKRCSTQWYA